MRKVSPHTYTQTHTSSMLCTDVPWLAIKDSVPWLVRMNTFCLREEPCDCLYNICLFFFGGGDHKHIDLRQGANCVFCLPLSERVTKVFFSTRVSDLWMEWKSHFQWSQQTTGSETSQKALHVTKEREQTGVFKLQCIWVDLSWPLILLFLNDWIHVNETCYQKQTSAGSHAKLLMIYFSPHFVNWFRTNLP